MTRRVVKEFTLGVSLAAFLTATPVLAVKPTVGWTVTRHESVTNYSEDTFRARVKAANVLIKYWDANVQADFDTDTNLECTGVNADIPCVLNFELSGTMGVFSDSGLGIIESASEELAVLAVSALPSASPYYRIKVVQDIRVCGGVIDPDITGCGRINATGDYASIVVEAEKFDLFQPEPGSMPSTYVHEYIHNVSTTGTHRNVCPFNIMNQYSQFSIEDQITGTKNWYNTNAINSTECTRMGGKPFISRTGSIYDGSTGPLTSTGEFYFVTGNITPPAGRTLTIGPGVEVQVKHGLYFRAAGGGAVLMRPGGTGNPVKVYSNCNSEYCTKTPY